MIWQRGEVDGYVSPRTCYYVIPALSTRAIRDRRSADPGMCLSACSLHDSNLPQKGNGWSEGLRVSGRPLSASFRIQPSEM